MKISQTDFPVSLSVVPTKPNAGLAAPEGSASAPPQAPPKLAQVHNAMNEIQKTVESVARDLRFTIDEDSGKPVVKIFDTKTDKLLRQIPSEEILATAKALDKLQGLLVQGKA